MKKFSRALFADIRWWRSSISPTVIGMLSNAQLSNFARDGYLVLPGVVDARRCEMALARIDELLQEQPPAAEHRGHHSYFRPADREPLLMGLFTDTPARDVAAEIVAPLQLEVRPQVQVALTLPPFDHRPGRGHIDGITPPEASGRPGTFTMLAGLVLSDQTRDDSGNLHVWPGSHHLIARYLQDQGADAILETGGTPPVEYGESVQIHAAPGDLLLSSYLLAHNTGGNISAVIRKTLYFRLKVAGHDEHWRQAITDALWEFPAPLAASKR